MGINWNYPTTMWIGENRIQDLSLACKELNISYPLFVTDRDLINLDLIKNITLRLKKNFKYKYEISAVKNLICKMGVKLEYLELRDKHKLSKNCNKSNFKIFISYYYKKIRL